MPKPISETTDIKAFVILNPDDVLVATIHIKHSSSGYRVDVNNSHDAKGGRDVKQYKNKNYLNDALHGAVVDGVTLAGDSMVQLDTPEGGIFPKDFEAPKGYRLANPSSELGGFRSCFKDGGLTYLSEIGYRVIEALERHGSQATI